MIRRNRRQAIPVQNQIDELTRIAYVRFIHGVPSLPPVDIYVNGNKIVDNISYGGYTPYIELPAGNVLFTFYRAGSTDELLGIITVNIPESSIFTVAGIGIPGRLELLQIPDTVPPPQSGTSSFLRFVNLSTDVPPLDLTVDNTQEILQNMSYKDTSVYRRLTPGSHTVDLTSSASGLRIFPTISIDLDPSKLYTLYAIGFNSDRSQRETVLLPDGFFNANQVV